nr:hypothetical protein [Tanacetum cinerariifolium]
MLQLPMLGGIGPMKLFSKRSRDVMNGKTSERLEGRCPVRWLLERSNPVKLVQFFKPTGNGPLSPISDREGWVYCNGPVPVPVLFTRYGYYRRFIKDYPCISQPLVALTKKDAFKWNPSAELVYHKLKEAAVKAPVLALPNFKQEFMVEIDASGKRIRAVMCQNGHPIAYWSKTLSARHQALTNHFSLKYLLNQKLTTPFQFKWLPKLLGYDYKIEYKKRNENVVAGALLSIDSSGELLQISVSSVSSGVWDKVKDSWKMTWISKNLIKSLEHHNYKVNKYFWTGGILKKNGKVVVRNDLELRKELVQHFHDEAIGGHSGAHVTMKKLGSLFYWKGLKKMVKQIIRDCNIHPVFHILQLKKCHGKDHSVGVLPQLREDGLLENKPMAILEKRLGKVNNKPVMFVLIQWTNKATWEIYGDLITRFPGFDVVNEVVP